MTLDAQQAGDHGRGNQFDVLEVDDGRFALGRREDLQQLVLDQFSERRSLKMRIDRMRNGRIAYPLDGEVSTRLSIPNPLFHSADPKDQSQAERPSGEPAIAPRLSPEQQARYRYAGPADHMQQSIA